MSPPSESTKAADFIYALEEKPKVWHEIMTTPAGPSGITTQCKDRHPIGFLYQVSPKPFLVSSPSIAYPSHSSLGNPPNRPPSVTLTSDNSLRLLDLNASTLLSLFVNCLYLNANTTPIRSSVLGYCPHQTPSREAYHIPNQLPMIHARRVAHPITTHLTSSPPLHRPHYAKPTNQIHLIMAIREPSKKGYIRLTAARQRINPRAFTPHLRIEAKMWPTRTRVLMK